jgi:hypothetical protein
MTALTRFAIQWIRVYEPVAGPLAFAHLAALAVTAAGIYLLVTGSRGRVAVVHPSELAASPCAM